MKVISLLQPWATLVVIGAKGFETRSWQTKHRGDLLIHASASKSKEGRELHQIALDLLPNSSKKQYPANFNDLPFGAIIGQTELLYIQRTEFLRDRLKERLNILSEHLMHPGSQELAFGDYSDGRFAWRLDESVEFIPVPAKGSLGLWDFPIEEVKKHQL